MKNDVHLNFDLSPDDIRNLCQKVIDGDIEALDEIAALNENEVSQLVVVL